MTTKRPSSLPQSGLVVFLSRFDRDENGSVRQSWAFGRWSDAESLRYIPINETMEVKREVYEGEFG